MRHEGDSGDAFLRVLFPELRFTIRSDGRGAHGGEEDGSRVSVKFKGSVGSRVSHLWRSLDDGWPVLEDDLDLRESPRQLDRGASYPSPDIDNRRLSTVFFPIIVINQRPMEEPLGPDHGLVGALAGESGFWGLEPFPDRHSVLELKRALLIAREFDAIYNVDPGLVRIVSPDEDRF